MRTNRIMGIASVTLGLLIAVSSILGPLWLNAIRQRISANVENQVIGADAVSLVLVAPLAILAGLLWWRGHHLAPLVALGPAIYAVYIYFQYIIAGAEYLRYDGNSERYFPLFYAIVLLGLIVAVTAWRSVDTDSLPMPGGGVRVSVAVTLLVLGTFLAFAWLKWVHDIAAGARPDEYAELPALSWLVKTMDLAFVVPVSVAAGIGLLLYHPAALKVAYGLTAAYALLAASVGSMALAMLLRDDPSAEPVFAIVLYTGAASLAVLTFALWRAFPVAASSCPRNRNTAHPLPDLRRHVAP